MRFSAFDIALQELWAMPQDNLETVLEIAAREHEADFEAVQAAIGKRLENAHRATMRGGVATVPITGPIFRYANLFTQFSGATSIEMTAQDLARAKDDRDVNSVLLAVDSPGGTVNGTNELAKMVGAVAAVKPVVAYVSGAGASGAYWIASAASQVFADETAQLGSIGVVGAFIDDSKRQEARGIKQLTFVSSQSPLKRPDLESEEGRAAMQARVDKLAQVFIEAVARNRNVDPETVTQQFGRGDVLPGAEAVAAGMADGISSYEEVLAGLSSGTLPGADSGRPHVQVRQELSMSTKLTAAVVASDYPDVASELRAEGRKEGLELGKTEGHAAGLKEGAEQGRAEGEKAGFQAGYKDGVEAERSRQLAIDEACAPGFETLAEECKADGSTAEEFAVKAMALQKTQGSNALDKAKEDEAKLTNDKLPAPESASEPAANVGQDENADKERWQSDAALREEFQGNEDAWLAYAAAQRDGRIRMFGTADA